MPRGACQQRERHSTLQVLDMSPFGDILSTWQKFLAHARQSQLMIWLVRSFCQHTGSHSAGISCTCHKLFCLLVVLCGTRSETIVAPSQLTQFWQILGHRTLSYSLSILCFITTAPSGETCKYAMAPSTQKTQRDSLPIHMLLSDVSVLVVVQLISEVPEGLMNYSVSLPKFSKKF
jgi:hypothetical protein